MYFYETKLDLASGVGEADAGLARKRCKQGEPGFEASQAKEATPSVAPASRQLVMSGTSLYKY